MSTRNGRNSQNALGIVPTEAPCGLSLEPPRLSNSHRASSREQKRIREEFGRQTLIIEGQMQKTEFGQSAIGSIHAHGYGVYQDAVAGINARRQEVRGEDFDPFLEEFYRLNLQACGNHLLSAAKVGAANIGGTIYDSLDLPSEPRKGLFG